MKIIVRKFGCFKNFLLYLETLLHITRLVFVIRKKLMSESSQNSTQILLDGKNGSPNSKQHLYLAKEVSEELGRDIRLEERKYLISHYTTSVK